MPDRVSSGSCRSNQMPREAVCVHTKKVYDSCKDKECLQDVRVYLTRCSQSVLDNSMNVKAKSAELLWAYIDVEPVPFNKGYFTVDVRYYYRITAEGYCGTGRTGEISGLAVFDKRTVLYGGEGGAKTFSSQYIPNGSDIQNFSRTNAPTAVIEVVDPVILSANVVDASNCCCECMLNEVPECICGCFDDDFLLSEDGKKLYVTLGQFSIIRLERDIQLLMPAYDLCIPSKECAGSCSDDPCELFQKFKFPVDQFFPPQKNRVSEKKSGGGSIKYSFGNGCTSKR